jgi:hypothetical protein
MAERLNTNSKRLQLAKARYEAVRVEVSKATRLLKTAMDDLEAAREEFHRAQGRTSSKPDESSRARRRPDR